MSANRACHRRRVLEAVLSANMLLLAVGVLGEPADLRTGPPFAGGLDAGTLVLAVGKCCFNIQADPPDLGCVDDVTEQECFSQPGEIAFFPGQVCSGDICTDCPRCLEDEQCGDSDACTDDVCDLEVLCTCVNTPNFDVETECCEPSTGANEPLGDGNPCTLDICDPATGEVTHPPAQPGAECDDGDECTRDDECDGASNCVSSPISGSPCTANHQCAPGVCANGVCKCIPGVDIPTVSEWGLITLGLGLAVLGTVCCRRRTRGALSSRI
jgi:hypothetical protein